MELPDRARFCRSCGIALATVPAEAVASAPSLDAAAGTPTTGSPASEVRGISTDRGDSGRSVSGSRSRLGLYIALGVATAALVAAAAVPLLWNSSTPSAEAIATPTSSSTESVPGSNPSSHDLGQRAGDCGVKLGTTPVTFASTTIPSDTTVERTTLCRMAQEASRRQEDIARQQFKQLCDLMVPQLQQTLGTTSFEDAAKRMRDMGAANDPSTAGVYAYVVRCADPVTTLREANSSVHLRIFSVGQARAGGGPCLAYLLEISGMQSDGGTTGYELHGTGACGGYDFQSPKSYFHPAANPGGRKPGDIIHGDFAYTGSLPSSWTYKGSAYAFGGDSAAPHGSADATAVPTEVATADSNTTTPPLNASPSEPPAAPPAELPNGTPAESGKVATTYPGQVGGSTPGAASGSGTVVDLSAMSIEELQRLAEQGSSNAWTEIGVRYLEGKGIAKDLSRAQFWFGKAAERGVPRAQTNLGWMYALGQGVQRDDGAAAELFRKAAEQGYPNAQDSLGWMYEHGRGVVKDESAAIGWYRKAASQGFVKSQQNLARLDSRGG